MPGNYWEDEVYAVPPLRALERTDSAATFDWLALTFRSRGGKIDWRSVDSGHTHRRWDDERSLAAAALTEIADRARPGMTVEHAGDALSPFGVRFASAEASAVVAALMEIPEQHYFVADDRSWLVAVSTEGDLDVVDRR